MPGGRASARWRTRSRSAQGELGRGARRFLEVGVEHGVEVEAFLLRGLGLPLQVAREGGAGFRVAAAAVEDVAGDDCGESGENGLRPSNHALEQIDAATQRHVNVRFDRAFVVEVDDANLGVLLAETVNAADALLHAHGIPRHVVIDERAAELEIKALGGGIGAKQHVGLAVAEAAFGFLA